METTNTLQLNDLYTVAGLAGLSNGVIGANQVRWQIRHRKANGLASACVLIGRKLLISKSRYEAWLAAQAGELSNG